MRRFEGRNAIVTGASRGIGAATSERLAAEGANLLLVARTVDQHDHLAGSLRETVERCRRHGTRVELFEADLANEESRARIVPHALDVFGGHVDVLVNNAAAAMYAPLADYPLKRRRITFEVNVHAPVDLMQAVLPAMLERGEGWIVNLSSASARLFDGPPFDLSPAGRTIGVYGASKAALNRLTNAFAAELEGTGVRINTVEPRSAVLSEGAEALVGSELADDQIESMEAMVEGHHGLVLLHARADRRRAREPRPARRARREGDDARCVGAVSERATTALTRPPDPTTRRRPGRAASQRQTPSTPSICTTSLTCPSGSSTKTTSTPNSSMRRIGSGMLPPAASARFTSASMSVVVNPCTDSPATGPVESRNRISVSDPPPGDVA